MTSFTKINPQSIAFGEPVAVEGGFGTKVRVSLDNEGSFLFTTPVLDLKWDCVGKSWNDQARKKVLLECVVPHGHDFYMWLNKLDEVVKEATVKHGKDWCGKQLSPEMVDMFYNTALKSHGEHGFSFRPQLSFDDATDKIKTPVYDLLDEDDMPLVAEGVLVRGAKVAASVKFSDIFISSNSRAIYPRFYVSAVKCLAPEEEAIANGKNFSLDAEQDSVLANLLAERKKRRIENNM